MKQLSVMLLLIFGSVFSQAQQTAGDQEKALQALKQAGIVRQEGNTLIYKVQKASDTAKVRLMYGNLFNNPNYKIRFEVDGKIDNPTKGIESQIQVPATPKEINNVKNPVSTNSNSSTGNCCLCNMKVFEYRGERNATSSAPLFTEYNWTVPEGVTKIKIEAWGAGGDGWCEMYTESVRGNDSIFNIRGGGGGGGAYLLNFVSVKPGDILRMKVPGGGSNNNLTIQLNDRFTGGLNLESGRNAKEAPGISVFNGKGGKLGPVSGIFSESTFSLKGTDGEEARVENYENNLDNVTKTSFGGAPRIDIYDAYDMHGGVGGDAPKSLHGGYEYKFIWNKRKHYPAGNGAYPGGGGGGSVSRYFPVGKGAPGVIIIYY